MQDSSGAFIEHCRGLGIANVTLAAPHQMPVGGPVESSLASCANGINVESIVHPFARNPDLQREEGQATEDLLKVIDAAATVSARSIYLVTGGRGSLSWE